MWNINIPSVSPRISTDQMILSSDPMFIILNLLGRVKNVQNVQNKGILIDLTLKHQKRSVE